VAVWIGEVLDWERGSHGAEFPSGTRGRQKAGDCGLGVWGEGGEVVECGAVVDEVVLGFVLGFVIRCVGVVFGVGHLSVLHRVFGLVGGYGVAGDGVHGDGYRGVAGVDEVHGDGP